MLEILYRSKNAVVISKPYGMPSEPDPSGSPDAMSETSRMLTDIGESGKLWLVHRLDCVVGGVMLFARSREVARELSEIIRDRQLAKEYIAVVEGRAEDGELFDYLYKDARLNRAVVTDGDRKGAKPAKLTLKTLDTVSTDKGERTLVHITLHTGRFHQIRAQLSSRGIPIVGDGKYGSRDNKVKCIALFSVRLELMLHGERIDVTALPGLESYPWSLFNIEERQI